jgi:hypothetical protein
MIDELDWWVGPMDYSCFDPNREGSSDDPRRLALQFAAVGAMIANYASVAAHSAVPPMGIVTTSPSAAISIPAGNKALAAW